MSDAPSLVERAAYRVVQEALTNIAKHAPGAQATVRVSWRAAETVVEVANGPAQEPTKGPSGGRGLIGLQQRVRLVGGSFEHGPRGDGFTVVARLPHRAAPSPAPVAAPVTSHVRQVPRRMGRSLAMALLAPALTFAALIGAVQSWQLYLSAQAVLDPADFARLRVGQERTEVDPVLPGRQTPVRPRVAEPAGDGMGCEYYSITANPLDDRSGDAYRLCFRDQALVHLDVLIS